MFDLTSVCWQAVLVISRHNQPTMPYLAAECGAEEDAIRPVMDRLMKAGRLALCHNAASPTSPYYKAV